MSPQPRATRKVQSRTHRFLQSGRFSVFGVAKDRQSQKRPPPANPISCASCARLAFRRCDKRGCGAGLCERCGVHLGRDRDLCSAHARKKAA